MKLVIISLLISFAAQDVMSFRPLNHPDPEITLKCPWSAHEDAILYKGFHISSFQLRELNQDETRRHPMAPENCYMLEATCKATSGVKDSGERLDKVDFEKRQTRLVQADLPETSSLGILFRAYGDNKCPETNPHPYYGGSYCCKTKNEKDSPGHGEPCDGTALTMISQCCENDEYIACPKGKCSPSNECLKDMMTESELLSADVWLPKGKDLCPKFNHVSIFTSAQLQEAEQRNNATTKDQLRSNDGTELQENDHPMHKQLFDTFDLEEADNEGQAKIDQDEKHVNRQTVIMAVIAAMLVIAVFLGCVHLGRSMMKGRNNGRNGRFIGMSHLIKC